MYLNNYINIFNLIKMIFLKYLKMSHSGIALAQHDMNNCNCDHPKKNIYCICGTSGGDYFIDTNNKNIFIPNLTNIQTCSYYTGVPCQEHKLKRKWSCCNKEIYGTLQDLFKLKCSNNN